MRFVFLFVLSAGLVLRGAPAGADARFEQLAHDYIEKMLEMHPERATDLGDHRFDGRWSDYSAAGRAAELREEKRFLAALEAIPSGQLSAVNRIDYQILRNRIQGTVYAQETLREWEWNPQT